MLCCLCFLAHAFATDGQLLSLDSLNAQQKGLEIAKQTDRGYSGFGDSIVSLSMTLTNAYGATSHRELRNFILESKDPNDGDWIITVFDRPRDVDGTALLTYAHILQPDDQWLYLPALKRVKRISSVNKSGSFLGSEFSFEDLSAQEVGKFSYQWLRDEACGERTCHVVERTPLYEHSGYTRQVVWTDSSDYLVRKIDYYDRKNDLLKTLTLTNYRHYDARIWRGHDFHMVNHVTRKETRLVWGEFSFQNGLDEQDFTTASLRRAR